MEVLILNDVSSTVPIGGYSVSVHAGNVILKSGNVSWTLDHEDTVLNGSMYGSAKLLCKALANFKKVGGSGQGAVESVTGGLVDNSDPKNPKVDLPSWVNSLRADRIGYVNMSNGNTYQLGSDYVDATGVLSSSSPSGLTNITFKFPSLTGVAYKRHMVLFKVDVDVISSVAVTNATINNVMDKAKKGDIWTLTYDSSSNTWDLEAINSTPKWYIDEKLLALEARIAALEGI